MKQKLKHLSILLLLVTFPSLAQVSGIVEDEFGPIAGAEVVVQSNQSSTITDDDGSFEIEAKVGDTLLVSNPFTMAEKELKVTQLDMGTINLSDGAITLDAVVALGYGIQESNDERNASYTKVDGEKLLSTTTTSLDQSLQGQVAGMQISAASGQPGASTPVFLRGVTSLTGSSQPLFVVDGVPVLSGDNTPNSFSANAISNIDPNSIENVTVLKDAAATSLYGARGANGVILITLKKGSKNRSNISLNTELGFGGIAYDKQRPMNIEQYNEYQAWALFNGGQISSFEDALAYQNALSDGKSFTDWSRIINRKNIKSESYNVSYTGGTEDVSLYSSLSYLKQDGVQINMDFSRFSYNLGADWKVNKRLSLDANINLSKTEQNSGNVARAAQTNPFFAGYIFAPFMPVYNADGSYFTGFNGLNASSNPIAIAKLNKNITTGYRGFSSLGVNYQVLDDLTFNSKAGVEFTYYDGFRWYNPLYGDGNKPNDPNGSGVGYKSDFNFTNYSWSNALNYNKLLGGVHNLSGTLAIEYLETNRNYSTHSAQGYPIGFNTLIGMNNAANPTGSSTAFRNTTFLSYVGRLGYVFDKKYALTANYRRDGSSRFSQGQRYGNFWGAGASWNLAKEEFLSHVPAVKNLKLRASYGQVGNAEISDYQWQALFSPSIGTYLNTPAGGINNPGSPDLQWEKTNQFNAGLDFGFFNHRISGSIDAYKKFTDNLLFDKAIPYSSSGFGSLLTNIGATQSKGLEFTLNLTPVQNADFVWDINANFSLNKSEVVRLAEGKEEYAIGGSKNLKVGHNPSEFYLRLWAGVDAENGNPLWFTDETKTQTTSNVREAKMVMTGKTGLPKYFGSLSQSISFKNFRLSAMANYTGGFSVYSETKFVSNSDGKFGNLNQFASAVDYWTPNNTDASNPKPIYGNSTNSAAASTRYLNDGDFIRLRNIELGYTLDQKVLGENFPVKSIYLYAKGVNLATWVFDKNLLTDPETAGYGKETALEAAGIYSATSPMIKQFLIGTKFNF